MELIVCINYFSDLLYDFSFILLQNLRLLLHNQKTYQISIVTNFFYQNIQHTYLQFYYYLYQYFEYFLCFIRDFLSLLVKNLFLSYYLAYCFRFFLLECWHTYEKIVFLYIIVHGIMYLIFLLEVLHIEYFKPFHGQYLHY